MSRISPKERGNIVYYKESNENNNISKTTGYWTSLLITNDGSSDLNITVNNLVMKIKSGETFDEDFIDFDQVEISASDYYRVWLRE